MVDPVYSPSSDRLDDREPPAPCHWPDKETYLPKPPMMSTAGFRASVSCFWVTSPIVAKREEGEEAV